MGIQKSYDITIQEYTLTYYLIGTYCIIVLDEIEIYKIKMKFKQSDGPET